MKSNQPNLVRALALGIALVGASLTTSAQHHMMTAYEMPIIIDGVIDATDCNNSGGPQVTLSGTISLGGVMTEIILQNNHKGTHKTSVHSESVALIDLGDEITIPKQPVHGGVGGNPHIYLQFCNGNGDAMTEEAYLGRCVQGLGVSAAMLNDVLAMSEMSFSHCNNKGGPFITLSGGVVLSGVKARIIFRNNVKGTHTAEVMRDIDLITDGQTIILPKQPVRGGVGGNPLISTRFLDGEGEPITELEHLGRCNKL